MQNTNPLLNKENTHRLKAIPFDLFKTEHFLPAIESALAEAKEHYDLLRQDQSNPTFENSILFMEHASERLSYVSGIFGNLLSAESDEEFKALAQVIMPKLSEFGSSIMTDQRIFERVKAVYEAEVKDKAEPKFPLDIRDKDALAYAERYRLIKKTYNSFIRNGALLAEEDKKAITAIDMEMAKLSPKYAENVLKATNAFELWLTDPAEVEGIPESSLNAAEYLARQKGKESGWLFNLQPSSMIPVLTYCKNRSVRERLFRASSARAFRDEFDNQENVLRVIQLRHQRARLLGYQNHAEYVLENRMAENIDTALDFLNRIYDIAYPAALAERDEVIAYAKELDGIEDFMSWDFSFYSNKLKEKKYDYDPEQLRPWFKVENVLDGLFVVANKIYGISLKQVYDIPTYHKDVKTYEVYDRDQSYLGLLYFDLFPRDTKRGGAWMTTFQSQGLYSDGMRRPFVSIVGSLTPSTEEQPSLLRLDEVRTIFHEFGHALHALLSDCIYTSLSGPSVLWDFVELPSQIMENWLLKEEALALFAKHYQTGEPLPQAFLDKVLAAKNFLAGIGNINQLRYGIMDFAWHTAAPDLIDDVDVFEKQVTEKFRLLPTIENTNISCSFSHVFAGGYSAGYYSYKWAEALEADAWAYFEEEGIFNQEIAQIFKETILARGNSYHPMELFVAFRGRKPDPDAVLRRDGLI